MRFQNNSLLTEQTITQHPRFVGYLPIHRENLSE